MLVSIKSNSLSQHLLVWWAFSHWFFWVIPMGYLSSEENWCPEAWCLRSQKEIEFPSEWKESFIIPSELRARSWTEEHSPVLSGWSGMLSGALVCAGAQGRSVGAAILAPVRGGPELGGSHFASGLSSEVLCGCRLRGRPGCEQG